MITLSASGGSVTFEFSGNSTYLNDGTITVPVNSLALIIDESDMATFRKAASNDIFVSANIAEFGMTKAELESWYKANMVGSTGGGGGVTSGEVQTMIDEAVSGKANSSDVYTTGQTSGATEIANALNAKLDTTAYTVDASINNASTNPVQNQALYDELRVETETTITFEGDYSTNYPSGCTTIKVEVSGTGDMETIGFYDSNWGQIGQVVIDTVHGYIVVDNNDFEGSTYTINGNIVTISYPSITNVKYLYTGNLYTYKAVTSVSTLKDVVNGKTNQSDFTAYTADTTPKVDGAWANSIKSPSLYYDYTSGITLSSLPISGGNYNYSSIATDASINANNGVLGVYTTGATHAVIKNDSVTNNRALINSIPSSIKMYWNLSYTGNTSHYIAASCLVNDGTNGYCQWDWKNNQYVPNNNYINTAVTLSYDSTNQVVTITPSSSSALTSIIYVRCNRNIAPATALTQDNCRIGLVTIDTNSYKLQEALDNKVDTSDVTTAVTSGSTDVVTSGGVYAKMGGMAIVKITESDYQSLSVKDPDTLYVVIPDPTNP